MVPISRTSTRRKSIPTQVRKAPRVRTEDTPGRATTAVDMAEAEQVPLSPAGTQEEAGLPGPSSNRASDSDQAKPMQTEVELSLIFAGMLPPCYKELVSASVHLAPPWFHEGVE